MIDNETLVHLLGYLTEKQWIDAFQNRSIDKVELVELAHSIEVYYNFKWSEELTKYFPD